MPSGRGGGRTASVPPSWNPLRVTGTAMPANLLLACKLIVVAFLVNVAIALYLLLAKRLFGLRGGALVEERERERDIGWEALERTAPGG